MMVRGLAWKLSAAAAVVLAQAAMAQTDAPTAPPGPTPGSPDGTLDQLKKQKEIDDARAAALASEKARVDAEKNLSESEAAAAKARLGTITGQSEIKGTIQLGSEPAKAEALLLVTRAVSEVARPVALMVNSSLDKLGNGRTVLVITDKKDLAANDALMFDVRRNQLLALADSAQTQFEKAEGLDDLNERQWRSLRETGRQDRSAPALTMVGALLDNAVKLGSYFQTDYTFGQVAVDISGDMFATALIDQMLRSRRNNAKLVLASQLLISDANGFVAQLGTLHARAGEAAGIYATSQKRAAELREAAAKNSKLLRIANAYDSAAAAANRVIGAYDQLMASLPTPEAPDRDAPALRIIRQQKVLSLLQGNPLVLYVSGRQAAAYYTKKSLWTFLGGAPLYVMGGTTISYNLFEADSAGVLASGTCGYHSGYTSVSKVERQFSGKTGRGRLVNRGCLPG